MKKLCIFLSVSLWALPHVLAQEVEMDSVPYVVTRTSHPMNVVMRDWSEDRMAFALYGVQKKGYDCYGAMRLRVLQDNMDSSSDSEESDEIIENVQTKLLTDTTEYSGRFEFEALSSAHNYAYEAGIFYERSGVQLSPAYTLHWDEALRVVLNRPDPNEPYGFCMGSCRFTIQVKGMGWNAESSDIAFKTMRGLIDRGENIQMVMIQGDHPYMDTIKELPCLRLTGRASIYRNHITARSSTGFKSLATIREIKEMPDDHEYRDNGTPQQGLTEPNVYRRVIDAINLFQIPHGPLPKGSDIQFWSYFERNQIPFFMSDSRYERYVDERGHTRIMSAEQMQAIRRALKAPRAPNVPFFLGFPIPFAVQHGSDDVFAAFARDQYKLIRYIEKKNIRNVFILTGDAHAAIASEFDIARKKPDGRMIETGNKVVEIMSSPLYQYFYDAAQSFSKTLEIPGRSYNYVLQSPWTLQELRGRVIRENNFAHIEVDPERVGVNVTYYKSAGGQIRSDFFPFW